MVYCPACIRPYLPQDCTSLTEITIPAALTTVGEKAFRGCTALCPAAHEAIHDLY